MFGRDLGQVRREMIEETQQWISDRIEDEEAINRIRHLLVRVPGVSSEQQQGRLMQDILEMEEA